MLMPRLEEIERDHLAIGVARALRIANERAIAEGTDLDNSLVTITEEAAPPPQRSWRIHYGPRDYVHQRGGDIIVLVDDQTATVLRVIRGQ